MAGYNRVLVAVDMTPEADEVLSTAHKVADDNGAELQCLTVVKPINYAYSGYESVGAYTAIPAFEEELLASARSSLNAKAKEMGLDQSKCDVQVGRPASTIKDYAQDQGVDLIVMGSHCRHGLGLLLGSTATGVLHGAPCDVLTVRVT